MASDHPSRVLALLQVILCVASGKALDFPGFPFPHLQSGAHEGVTLTGLL